jgi:hypothetical protein
MLFTSKGICVAVAVAMLSFSISLLRYSSSEAIDFETSKWKSERRR